MDGPISLAGPRLAPPDESRALTGLRGIGALLVMAHHFYLHLGSQRLPVLGALLQNGFMGVDLFFVLSGFVMSMVYGAWFDGSAAGQGAHRVLHFLVRRIARLWPLHAAILAIILALRLFSGEPAVSLRMVAANFALVQAWGISAAINPPAWSASTELLAYLVFPLLAAFLLRSRPGPPLGAACVVALLTTTLVLAPPLGPSRRGLLDLYQNDSVLPCLRCLAGFITGMLAWRAGTLPQVRRWCSAAWAAPVAFAGSIATLSLGNAAVLGFALLPLVVLAMHFGTSGMCRMFAGGVIHRLGVLSYAIYLIHYALLQSFPLGSAPLPVAIALFLIVTVGLASLAHLTIEMPGRIAVRRLGEALVGRLAPARPA